MWIHFGENFIDIWGGADFGQDQPLHVKGLGAIRAPSPLTWSGWSIANGWIMMRAMTSWHVKYGKDDDDDDFCEDWRDEVENCLHVWICTRE